MKRKISNFCRKIADFFTPALLLWIIVLLLSLNGLIYFEQRYPNNYLARIFLIPVFSSLASAVIVTFTIDLKSRFSALQNVIIDAFTSNSFLEKLDETRLKNLRAATITQIHRQKFPNMQEGLMDMDKEIFRALQMPYYETFRETGIYSRNIQFEWEEGKSKSQVLKRHVSIQYTIKSPRPNNEETIADVSMTKHIQTEECDILKNARRIFNIQYFFITIDDGDRTDIVDELVYNYKPLGATDDYYNTLIELSREPNHSEKTRLNIDTKKTCINIPFKKEIKVDIAYDIYLPTEDNHFTNRLKYPAKSYRVDCICEDTNVKFYGQLLGTFTQNSAIKINHPADHIWNIESYEWLLPRNGVFVIMCEKSAKKERY